MRPSRLSLSILPTWVSRVGQGCHQKSTVDGLVELLRSAIEADSPRLNIVLYGSQLDPTVQSVDVDVWCDGPPSAIARWQYAVQLALGQTLLDVIQPADLLSRAAHRMAVQWWASRGVAVTGSRPLEPKGVGYADVCRIYAASACESAWALLTHAQALALAGQPTADRTGRVAARACLRAMAQGPEQSRGVRRLSDRQVADALIRAAPSVRRGIRQGRWSDETLLDALADLLLKISNSAGAEGQDDRQLQTPVQNRIATDCIRQRCGERLRRTPRGMCGCLLPGRRCTDIRPTIALGGSVNLIRQTRGCTHDSRYTRWHRGERRES